MLNGKIIRLVHLSSSTYLLVRRLTAANHNDHGYGIIEDEDGREVYFSHEVVENYGFDYLRQGQQLEYELEKAPYLRATSVRVATAIPVNMGDD